MFLNFCTSNDNSNESVSRIATSYWDYDVVDDLECTNQSIQTIATQTY